MYFMMLVGKYIMQHNRWAQNNKKEQWTCYTIDHRDGYTHFYARVVHLSCLCKKLITVMTVGLPFANKMGGGETNDFLFHCILIKFLYHCSLIKMLQANKLTHVILIRPMMEQCRTGGKTFIPAKYGRRNSRSEAFVKPCYHWIHFSNLLSIVRHSLVGSPGWVRWETYHNEWETYHKDSGVTGKEPRVKNRP